MLKIRLIPALLLRDEGLVKTVQFSQPRYIGDPINTVRIFNELEVDELLFLDIMASKEKRKPNFRMLAEIADECFMPLAYGGGIGNFEDVRKIFQIGFEKVSINTALANKEIIRQLAEHFGRQSIIVSVDVKKNFWGKYEVWSHHAQKNMGIDPVSWAQELESLGAGEILLTSVEREGTWKGLDAKLVKEVSQAVEIPIIAHGGAGKINDITEAVVAGASAVAMGSMVVYQQKGMGVLVNFPDRRKVENALQAAHIQVNQ